VFISFLIVKQNERERDIIYIYGKKVFMDIKTGGREKKEMK